MGRIIDPQLIEQSKELSYYDWNGILCVKTRPKHVHNPRTPEQQLGRSKFGLVAHLGSKVLHTLIHPYWNPIAKKKKRIGYNLFLSTNTLVLSNGDCSIKKLKLILDNGLNQEEFTVIRKSGSLQISWDSTKTDHRKNANDQLCLMSLTDDLDFELIETNTLRKDHSFELALSSELKKYYFVFWRNGNKWSESILLFSE